MEVPRRRHQREAGDTARPARGQCDRERAAHAVAQHRRRPARAFGNERQGPFEARDVGRGVEAALLFVGRAPVDEIGPQSLRRHGAQQALLGGEVEHFPAVDQRRHDQHGPRPAPTRRAMGGTVVEQARVAFAPDGGRLVQRAVDLVALIGEDAVGQAPHAPQDLALQRLFEFAGASLRLEGADLRQQRRQRFRRCGCGTRVLRAALQELPRAFGARPGHQRRSQMERQRAGA